MAETKIHLKTYLAQEYDRYIKLKGTRDDKNQHRNRKRLLCGQQYNNPNSTEHKMLSYVNKARKMYMCVNKCADIHRTQIIK